MENILTEELLKQLRLIKYDRSKTLLEQKEYPVSNPVKSDRLGDDGNFSATPKIFSDDVYKNYQKLSPEEKEKLESEFLNDQWKSRLCTKNAQQKHSVFDGEYYTSHEDFCKPFGGTQIYKSGEGGGVLGQGYFCGCKNNGEVLINNKIQKVNDYLNRPYTESTYVISEFLNDQHNILMIAGILFAIFGGAVFDVLALGIDAIDVGLYIEEGDPFMAGLSAMFALLPMGDLIKLYVKNNPGVKNASKKLLINILERLKLKKPLTKEQEKFIKALNESKMVNLAYWKMVRIKIRKIIMGESPSYFVRFLVWLVEKGILSVKFLLKFGLIIGGIFYSWYKIADWLGIKPKGEGNEIKDISKYDFVELNVLNYLRNMEKSGFSWSIKNSKTDLPQVAAIQYALYAGGYFTPMDPPSYKLTNGVLSFSSSKNIKNVKIYNVAGRLMDNLNNDKNDNFSSKNKLTKGVYILKITNTNGTEQTIKITYAGDEYKAYNFGKVTNKVKWGHYDEYTKNAVENYQEKNSLSVDGVAGKNTIKSLISDIEKNKITDFTTPETISGYNFNKDVTINDDYVNLTPEDFEEAYEQQQANVLDSMDQAYSQKYMNINGDSLSRAFENGLNIVAPPYPNIPK
jgi:peptidoglycan hydrolase-like protein with peptidoglycan-binding domain